MLGRNRFQIKTPDQIRTMRRAGLVVAKGLEAMRAVAVPGATTADIDRAGRDVLEQPVSYTHLTLPTTPYV